MKTAINMALVVIIAAAVMFGTLFIANVMTADLAMEYWYRITAITGVALIASLLLIMLLPKRK